MTTSFALRAAVVASVVGTPLQAQHQHAHGASATSVAHAAHGKSQLAPEAVRQLAAVRQATARYIDHEAAERDGYVRFGREEQPLMGEHWYRKDLVAAPLDLTRPSTLQYASIDGKRMLVGVAYTVYQRPGEDLPDGFAGDQDHWHVHDVPKLMLALTENRPFLRKMAERRIARGKAGAGDGRTRLVMLHAWVGVESPDGPFSMRHRALPYLKAGLPASFADSADEDAAFGVSLLEDGACRKEVVVKGWVAGATRDQKDQMMTACDEAAARVKDMFARGPGARELNAIAGEAWRSYARTRESVLTDEQKRRLASVVEHP